jgi:hypothetical protein
MMASLQGASKGFSPAQAHAVTVSKHGLQESLKGELFDVVMVSLVRTHIYPQVADCTPSLRSQCNHA